MNAFARQEIVKCSSSFIFLTVFSMPVSSWSKCSLAVLMEIDEIVF